MLTRIRWVSVGWNTWINVRKHFERGIDVIQRTDDLVIR